MNYDEIYNKTKEIIIEYLRLEENELQPETNLVDDLYVDSIAMVELSFRFTEVFSVPMVEPSPELFIMKNLVAYLHEKSNERN